MQKFSDQHLYPASTSTVLEKFTDETFLREKYTALGREDIEFIAVEKTADEARMEVRYSDKPDMNVPSFAKKFVPERAVVKQTVVWDLQSQKGVVTVVSEGSPITISGSMQLSSDGDNCQNLLKWEVSCSIPLVGGKLEKLLVEGLKAKGQRDEAITQSMLG